MAGLLLQSAAARLLHSTVESEGLGGVIWVEGQDLPPAQALEPLLHAALTQAFTSTGPGSPEPPAVRLSSARTNGATVRFCFEVAAVLSASEASWGPVAKADARATLASRLQCEALCRGSARLLPTLVELLEAECPGCSHCRLRLELDEATGCPGEGRALGNAAGLEDVAGQRTSAGLSCWVSNMMTRMPSRAYSEPLPTASWTSSQEWTGSGVSARPVAVVSTPPPQLEARSTSPTAINLARNPKLRARVMASAIPLDSELGRRLSGRRVDRSLRNMPPKNGGNKVSL